METTLSWNNVVNIEEKLVEFVACHELMAWRRHEGCGPDRFRNLERATTLKQNCARLLLSPKGNANAKKHSGRGQASHVAVWYADQPWAILMNKQEGTLVRCASCWRCAR